MAREIRITDAEWDVMEIVWDRGVATAADVIAALAESKAWNHRTIRTLLARLAAKGALRFEVDGNRHVYRPAVKRQSCVRRESRSFLERIFAGDAASLLVHFVRESELTAAQLAELEQALAAKQDQRGTAP